MFRERINYKITGLHSYCLRPHRCKAPGVITRLLLHCKLKLTLKVGHIFSATFSSSLLTSMNSNWPFVRAHCLLNSRQYRFYKFTRHRCAQCSPRQVDQIHNCAQGESTVVQLSMSFASLSCVAYQPWLTTDFLHATHWPVRLWLQ